MAWSVSGWSTNHWAGVLLQSLAVDLGAVATFAFLLRRDLKARDKQVPGRLRRVLA